MNKYRSHFKNAHEENFYLKQNYDLVPICNSKYNSQDCNFLSRFNNTVASGLNKIDKLPKYMVMVLDDDLIRYVDFYNCGMSSLFGECLEWLITQVNKMIAKRKAQLPAKAVHDDYPFIYWVAAPMHKNADLEVHKKFNDCLESIVRQIDNMRVAKVKEFWAFEDEVLVNEDGIITPVGLSSYWKAVDAAIKYNVQKRNEFLRSFTHRSGTGQATQSSRGKEHSFKRTSSRHFKRFRNARYHWSSSTPARRQ